MRKHLGQNGSLLLIVALLLLMLRAQAQAPIFSIAPEGTMSVCPGTTVPLSASVADAFAGTGSYQITDIPFSPQAIPGGTNVNMNNDTVIGPLAIGFQFCFFNNTYTQFYLGSNGWIGFSPAQPKTYSSTSIPSMLAPRNSIMGAWMDLNPQVAGGPYIKYQTQGTAPYRRLVVQYSNVPLHQCTSLKATMQIVIYESTNVIETYLTNKPSCATWAGGTSTHGLNNSNGTVAVTVPGRNASVWTATNDAKRFQPDGPPNYTINWTANGFPFATGASTSRLISTDTRIIGRVNFQCSNLILYDTLDVTVGGAASAEFSVNGSGAASPPVICTGSPVTFAYTGGAAGTGTWTFPGGSFTSANGLANQVVTWNAPGTYTVELDVTPSDGGCLPGHSSKTITVVAGPSTAMTLPASACVGNTVSVGGSGTAAAGATYSWNFGAGASPATASGFGPHSVSWSTSGSKTVSLSVTKAGCTSSGSGSITINTAPTTTISVTPATICVGSAASLTYTGNGSSVSWNFGAGASPATANGAGPHAVTWSGAGAKTVSVTATGGGCSSTASHSVTVTARPSANFTLPASVCVGESVSATYTGGAPAAPAATYTWNLNGGTPAAGNVQSPSMSWATAGAKTVSLSVTQSGCTSTAVTRNITVNAKPTTSITSASPTVCVGQSTSLSVSGAALPAGTTYSWNFGAGASPATSTSAGPISVSWNSTGNKSASLSVTANGCTSNPATVNVAVAAAPSGTITAPASVCVNTAAAISVNGTFPAGTTFNWNFAGGTVNSGSGAGPYQVEWAGSGTKNISVTITQGACSTVVNGSLTVNAMPATTFTLPATICQNQAQSVSYSGAAQAGATYSWNFGAGASPATATGAGPHSVSWSTTGNKSVQLSVIRNGCTATQTRNTTVNPVYTTGISVPATICKSSAASISYSGNAPAGSSYSWNFGTGASPATATGAGPHSVTWSSAGTPSVSLTVSNGGCSATGSQNVTVQDLPVSTFTLPGTLCAGNAVSLTPAGGAVAGTTYTWNFGAGASPATANGAGPHSVSWSTSGSKTVTLTATRNGCSTTTTRTGVVNALPLASFSLSTEVCQGSNTSVTYTGGAPGTSTFNWNFGANASPATATGIGPHSVSWTSAGNKTVQLTVTQNGCTSVPVTQNIQVKALPSASFSLTDPGCIASSVEALYTGGPAAGKTFNWTHSGATLQSGSGAGPLDLRYSTAGSKSVSLRVIENGCTSAVITRTTTINTAPSFSISGPQYAGAGIPVTITYTGSQAAGTSWNWNFNGGTVVSGSGSGPYEIKWNTAGIKTITCTATVNGCSPVVRTIQVEVVSGPVVSISAGSGLCQGDTALIEFTGSTFGANPVFNWNFSGGTVLSGSGAGPYLVKWSAAGTKNVSLQVTDLGVTESDAISIQVFGRPFASITSPAVVCAGQGANIRFSGVAGPSAVYNWNFDGGVPAGPVSANNTVTFASAGNYTVSLSIAENGCAGDEVSRTIEVRNTPSAVINPITDICAGDVTEITLAGTPDPAASYSWVYSGGEYVSGSGSGPLEIRWDDAGQARVSLVIAKNGCSSDSISAVFNIKPRPTSTFTVSGGLCAGDSILLTYTGMAGAGASYSWTTPAGELSGIGPHTVSIPTEGAHAFWLSVSENDCSSAAGSGALLQNSRPVANFSISDTIFVSENATALYSGTIPSGASFAWSYPSATHISGSGAGPVELNWTNPGTYQVELQIDNGGCLSLPVSETVVVLPIPAAQFAMSADSVCSGSFLEVVYTGMVHPSINYNWDFQGAEVLSGSGPGPYQLRWANSGIKNISLEISVNGQASDPEVQALNVIAMPSAAFNIPDNACAGEAINVQFEGQVNASQQFSWSFDGATLLSGDGAANAELSWGTPGEKSVILSVADAMCIAGPEMRRINVHAIPDNAFELPAQVCVNEEVTLEASSPSPSAQYTWAVQGTAAAGIDASQIVKWSNPGAYTVSLTASENGCTSALNVKNITVHARPAANAGTDVMFCSGDTVQIGVPGQAGLTYKWTPGGLLSDDTQSQPFISMPLTHQEKVEFYLLLQVSDANCSATDSIKVTVAPKPVANVTIPAPQCLEGNSFTFNAGGAFSEEATFIWDFGTHGFTHTPYLRNQEGISFDSAGKHPVSLVINQFGCSSNVFTDTVIVNAHPEVQFTPESAKGCVPLLVNFNAGTAQPGYKYNWTFGDGRSGTGASPSHTYNKSGYMSVTLSVTSDAGCVSSLKKENTVLVFERPEAGFRAMPEDPILGKDQVDLVSFSQNALYCYYVIGADTILGCTNSFVPKTEGTVTVTQVVVNSVGCEDKVSRQIKVHRGTRYYIPNAFSPNNDGKNDLFLIEARNIKEFSLSVYDRWGRLVFTTTDINEGWDGMARESTIPLPEGVYPFRLEMKDMELGDIVEMGQITLFR